MIDEDLLLFNCRIYTLDAKNPIATGILIRRDRILAIGDGAELRAAVSHGTRHLDLEHGVITPGLIDAHIHLDYFSHGLQKVDCEVESRAECLQRVADRAQELAPGEWLLGHGWNQNVWREGFGSAKDLDDITKIHPIYLTAKSLHVGWVNSLALSEAKINSETPDPPRGRIGRNQDGTPNGLLYEGAMELISRVLPERSPAQLADAILAAQKHLHRLGLTGLHDYDHQNCFAALGLLHQQNLLGMRVVKNIPMDDLKHAVELGLRFGFGDNFLRIGGIKLFADGALGPHTAAMFEPFEDDPGNLGMLLLDAEEIFELGCEAASTGLPLTVHAIGDRANHEVLNALRQLRKYEQKNQMVNKQLLRHRIEHVQLLHPEDVPCLAELGIIASMQPIHATSDMEMADKFWGRRSAFSYAFNSQLQNGAVLVFGSDAPVEDPNPFWGLHAAVTRRRKNGKPGVNGWYPEQRLSIEESMLAYTKGPAYAAGLENELGMLVPGFLADLLVLDVDPFLCEPDELLEIRPRATMVGGQWMFGYS